MKSLVALLALTFLTSSAFAQAKHTPAASTKCASTSFTGEVRAGQSFTRLIGSGLTYRLAPLNSNSNDPKLQGWTIEIAYIKKPGEVEREFSWVMTPPYRQTNARQLNTMYGKSIEEALNGDHIVYFTLNIDDYAQADEEVTHILWKSTPAQLKESAEVLPKIPTGSANLSILRSTGLANLKFRVEVIVPASVQLAPELDRLKKPATCLVSPLIPVVHEMLQ